MYTSYFRMNLQIPAPVMNFEALPLSPPIDNPTALDLWDQIPNELKENGFGYYMRQYEANDDMPINHLYWSYLANYYYFQYDKQVCSFYDWQDRVRAKVGGYRDDFAGVIDQVVAVAAVTALPAAIELFDRDQLLYYGW